MLPHLLQIRQTRLLPFQNGAHPSERGTFEAFAAVERVAVFDHADHITCDGVDEGACRVDLAEGEFVVVAVVECVAEVRVEGVYVGEAGEICEHFGETFGDCLLGEFDLSHVERSNSVNLVSRMNHCWCTSLGPGQDYIHQFCGGRYSTYLL